MPAATNWTDLSTDQLRAAEDKQGPGAILAARVQQSEHSLRPHLKRWLLRKCCTFLQKLGCFWFLRHAIAKPNCYL